MCLLAVIGSQGIVVKCTAAIFFPTVDWLVQAHLSLISALAFAASARFPL